MLDVTARVGRPALACSWLVELGAPVGAVEPSPDGRAIAVALVDGPVLVLSSETGETRWRGEGHAAGTLSLGWRGDGGALASSGLDGRTHVYASVDGTRLATLECGDRWVAKVAFEPAGARLATAAGGRLRLWSSDGELLTDWAERTSTILDIAWRPLDAGPPAIATTSYGAVGVYDPRRVLAPIREYRWQGSSLVLAWSPNAK